MANKRKILLVDDDPDMRAIARMSLKVGDRFDVIVAADGYQALELARSEAPDALLMDVMMPGLDGPGVMARLRVGHKGTAVPVIFLTGKIDPKEFERLRALGAVGVIGKPFDPMSLGGQVEEMLENE